MPLPRWVQRVAYYRGGCRCRRRPWSRCREQPASASYRRAGRDAEGAPNGAIRYEEQAAMGIAGRRHIIAGWREMAGALLHNFPRRLATTETVPDGTARSIPGGRRTVPGGRRTMPGGKTEKNPFNFGHLAVLYLEESVRASCRTRYISGILPYSARKSPFGHLAVLGTFRAFCRTLPGRVRSGILPY